MPLEYLGIEYYDSTTMEQHILMIDMIPIMILYYSTTIMMYDYVM